MAKKLYNTTPIHVNDFDDEGNFLSHTHHPLNTPFGFDKGELEPEKDRYIITWMPVCPFCHRLTIVRELLGLQDVIQLAKLFIVKTDTGVDIGAYISNEYDFEPEGDSEPAFLLTKEYKRIYPDFEGLVSASNFFRKNEDGSYDFVNEDWDNASYYLETEFKKWHKEDAPDLLPKDFEEDIKSLNTWIFDRINNGVYKTGFAQSQQVYNKEYNLLFEALDQLEERLSHSRYLFGDYITDSDVRLYTTLCRFDIAYYQFMNCNRNRLIDYSNLWNYAKDLYSIPAFKKTTFFEEIKKGYFSATGREGVVPNGPDLSSWNKTHDKELKFLN